MGKSSGQSEEINPWQQLQICGRECQRWFEEDTRDFDIRSMKRVDQKKRANMINLGLYARKRDVIKAAKYLWIYEHVG